MVRRGNPRTVPHRAPSFAWALSATLTILAASCGNPQQEAASESITTAEEHDAGIRRIQLPPQSQAANVLGADAPDDAVIVSLSFDDGFASQERFFELLEEHEIDSLKATFYINSSRLNLEFNERESRDHLRFAPLDLWLEAARQGHEIGSHTVSHLDLSCDDARAEGELCQNGHVAIDDDERRRQICADRQMLLSLGFDVTGFAYPFGRHELSTGDRALHDIVARCGFDYARRVSGLRRGQNEDGELPLAESFPPANHLSIRSYTSLTEDVRFEDLRGWILDAVDTGGGWVPLILHHVSTDCRDPENPDEQLGVCTLEAELGKLLRWLARVDDDAAPDQVFVRTIGQVMSEVGPSSISLVANGDLEDEHSGSIERPNCFDRFQGLHETNFEWVDTESEPNAGRREFRGADGRFERLLPTDSHPTPLLQMTTRDDGCYAGVSPSLSYQARVRARVEQGSNVGMRFVFRVLRVDATDAGANPVWSDWEVDGSTFELTESWSTYAQNIPELGPSVVALAFGVQYLTLDDDEDPGELWVDDFELREFQ